MFGGSLEGFSLQELSALHGLGVPEYLIEDEGPDHMKTFTARVRVEGRMHGHGVGRSKKEAEQQAAESAYRTLSTELAEAAVSTAATPSSTWGGPADPSSAEDAGAP